MDSLIYKSPVIDAEGRLLGIVGTAIDITELRQKAAIPKSKISPESGKEPSRRELEALRGA